MVHTKREFSPDGAAETNSPREIKTYHNSTQAEHITTPDDDTNQDAGAREAVFSTAELLENILRLLPDRSVYNAYRVCRQWRDLVDSSILLQQKLFLQPSTRRQVWQVDLSDGDRDFWHCVADDTPIEPAVGFRDLGLHTVMAVRLNPLMTLAHPWASNMNHIPASTSRAYHSHKEFSTIALSGATRSSLPMGTSPTGVKRSALSAYLTDPPVQQVKISRTYKVDEIRTKEMLSRKSYKEWLANLATQLHSATGVECDTSDYEIEFKQGKMEHTITVDTGVTFQDVFAALDQPGEFFYHAWCNWADIRGGEGDTEDEWIMVSKSGITINDGLRKLREEQGFEGFTMEDEILVEMTGVTVPSEDEWFENRLTLKHGVGFLYSDIYPEYRSAGKIPTVLI